MKKEMKTFNEIQVAISVIKSNMDSKKSLDEMECDTMLYERLQFVNSGLQQMYKQRDIEGKKVEKGNG
jgi:hypothetical protein